MLDEFCLSELPTAAVVKLPTAAVGSRDKYQGHVDNLPTYLCTNSAMADHAESDSDRPRSAESTNSGQTASKSVGPQKLLEAVERVYKQFNPAQVTLDTHVDASIEQMQVANSIDETFIRQVVYGVIRYRQLLGSTMDSFYHYNGGTALREDMDMYKIFGYLTIFRFEELGHSNMKRLVDAKEPQKMVVFFRYLFDEQALQGALRDDWLKLYDKEFVDGIVKQLLALRPQMTAMLDSLEERVYFTRRRLEDKEATASGAASDTSKHSFNARRAPTTQQPFNLSEPRPKPLPVPPPAPKPFKPKLSPPPRDGPTKEELALQAAKEANRKKLERQWAKASPFRLRCSERPTNIDKIRTEIEMDLARQLTFRPPKPNPVPAPPSATVKLNTAAILREDALYRKKQAEEAADLQRYEAELHDASKFKAWKAAMLNMDEAARAAEVEARRIAMAAVQEAAIKARAAQVEENQELGRLLKAQSKALEEAKEREVREEVASKQARRAQVIEARAGVAQAAERLAADKRATAEEERKKQAADAKAMMEAQLKDIAEKRDIIMQLRALEKAPQQRVVEFDPTDMPDHGLLESMPLVELRERLLVAKRRAKEEEERKRAQNLAERQEREAALLDKVANIQRVRKVAAAQAQLRRNSTTAEAAATQASLLTKHESGVLELNAKLEAKRAATAAEAARIAAETKRIRFEQMQQAAGALALEENKFRELRQGAQREAVARQVGKFVDTTLLDSTKAKAQAMRLTVLKQAASSKRDFLREYEERLTQAKRGEVLTNMIMQRGLVQRALGSCQNRVSLHRLPTTGPRLRESPSRPASRDGETSDEINSRRLSESEAVAARVEYVEDVSSLHAVLDATRDMLVVLDVSSHPLVRYAASAGAACGEALEMILVLCSVAVPPSGPPPPPAGQAQQNRIQGETLCETGFDEPELHWKGDQRLVAAKQQAACENVRHTFARVARECPDVKFLEIDVEDGPGGDAVKAQLGVKVLPTIQPASLQVVLMLALSPPLPQFYKNRQLLWQQQGYMGLEAQLGEGVLYYDGSAANGVHVNDHVADLVTRQALHQFVAQGLDDASLRVVNVATRICQPCIKVFPAVLALARNFQGLVQFARFLGDESDEAEEVMHELGIVEVPTFIFYRQVPRGVRAVEAGESGHGQEVGRHVGSSRADLIGKVLELQSAAGMAVPEPLGVKPRGSRSRRAAYRP
ncbi:hypothetical protein QJQ45_029115 [Haematococcus lacustris]|nr:hypothetical protein QJQ45_029115 [Haematococcus lacustris]